MSLDNFLDEMMALAAVRPVASKIFNEASADDRFNRLNQIVSKTDKKRLAISIKYSGSNFDSLIFVLISKAQSSKENYYRLRMGFPDYVDLWEEWQASPNEEDFFKKYGVE